MQHPVVINPTSLWRKLSWSLLRTNFRVEVPANHPAPPRYIDGFLARQHPSRGAASEAAIPTIVERTIIYDQLGEPYEMTMLADGSKECRRFNTPDLRHRIAVAYDKLDRRFYH